SEQECFRGAFCDSDAHRAGAAGLEAGIAGIGRVQRMASDGKRRYRDGSIALNVQGSGEQICRAAAKSVREGDRSCGGSLLRYAGDADVEKEEIAEGRGSRGGGKSHFAGFWIHGARRAAGDTGVERGM